MSGKKILMLTGEFTEEYEIYVFQKGMEAVGHTVHVVCPDKKAGDRIKTSLHDFEGDQTYTEKLGHYADINKTFSEVRPEEYDAVYAAGGRGPEYIRTDKRVQDMV
ncbi:DJ-1/PfpI family protein, partial [Sinorhizobium meliloti]